MAAEIAFGFAGLNLMATFGLLILGFALAGEVEHGRDYRSLAEAVRWVAENVVFQPAWSIWGDQGDPWALPLNLAVWGLVPGLLVGIFATQKDLDEWQKRSRRKSG